MAKIGLGGAMDRATSTVGFLLVLHLLLSIFTILALHFGGALYDLQDSQNAKDVRTYPEAIEKKQIDYKVSQEKDEKEKEKIKKDFEAKIAKKKKEYDEKCVNSPLPPYPSACRENEGEWSGAVWGIFAGLFGLAALVFVVLNVIMDLPKHVQWYYLAGGFLILLFACLGLGVNKEVAMYSACVKRSSFCLDENNYETCYLGCEKGLACYKKKFCPGLEEEKKYAELSAFNLPKEEKDKRFKEIEDKCIAHINRELECEDYKKDCDFKIKSFIEINNNAVVDLCGSRTSDGDCRGKCPAKEDLGFQGDPKCIKKENKERINEFKKQLKSASRYCFMDISSFPADLLQGQRRDTREYGGIPGGYGGYGGIPGGHGGYGGIPGGQEIYGAMLGRYIYNKLVYSRFPVFLISCLHSLSYFICFFITFKASSSPPVSNYGGGAPPPQPYPYPGQNAPIGQQSATSSAMEPRSPPQDKA